MLQTQDMGKVIWALMGDYSATENYEKLDVVDFTDANGVELTYYCLADHLNQPVTNTTYWKRLSAPGATGDNGADSIVPGPPGADSTIAGPPGRGLKGDPGEQGADGNSRYSSPLENVAGTITDVGPSVAGTASMIGSRYITLVVGSIPRVEALIPYEIQPGGQSEVKQFEQKVDQRGTLRAYATFISIQKSALALDTITVRIKKNGVTVGTFTNSTGTAVTAQSDIAVTFGDIITMTASKNGTYGYIQWHTRPSIRTNGVEFHPTYPNKSYKYSYSVQAGGAGAGEGAGGFSDAGVYDNSNDVSTEAIVTATTDAEGLVELSTSAENTTGTSDVVVPTVAGVTSMISTHETSVWKSAWVTATSYVEGDQVKATIDSTVRVCICLTANSDATFTASKWYVLASV